MNKLLKNNIKIIFATLTKMGPYYLISNPMMLLVWFISITATGIFLREIYLDKTTIYLYGQMTFWLWMTIFFSCLADSYADSKLPNDYYQHKNPQRTKLARKLNNLNDLNDFKFIPYSKVNSGNYILLESGDEVPFDGIVIAGKCYVYESDLTGSVGDVLKSPKGNNTLIAGSDLYGQNDWLVMKVTFAKDKSFFAKSLSNLERIRRHAMPSELALERIIFGLSILFISAIFTVAVIADYSGVHIPLIYLLDLVVILLPTTISGLQKSIIIFAKARAAKIDIIVHDHVALDNAVDIQIALIDKTGTLTIGRRQMTDFQLTCKSFEKNYLYYLLLSSIQDDTPEGKSVVRYVQRYLTKTPHIIEKNYIFHNFTSSQPISGCEYEGLEIRKGSIAAIAKYLAIKVKDLPLEITKIAKNISKTHGTPILFTVNKKIVGIIHLRDRFRKGVIQQLQKLKDEGIQLAMITGDNELTASYMAQKLAIDNFYGNCTPEKKLSIIKTLQNRGYIVAVCGDGINDALAMAQANIGFILAKEGKVHSILSGNIISKKHDISKLLDLKNICRIMTAKRGALTVFSLASDIAKYFVIVPALFTTAFPQLSVLNFLHFKSLESVILASVMFNALIIYILLPFVFNDSGWTKNKRVIWKNVLLFGLGGLISPFIGIKFFDIIIDYAGLL